MITRLRVQGFKSLLDAEVYFGPFTCFIGPNAAGKSNIFDSLRFLSLLAELPIMEAAAHLRQSASRSQDPRCLFTQFGRYVAPEIRIEADLLIGKSVEDDFGVVEEATRSPLRYEVAFRLADSSQGGRFELVHESLDPLPKDKAKKTLAFPHSLQFENSILFGRRSSPYISSKLDEEGNAVVSLHQDGRSGRLRQFPAKRALRTTLSGTETSEYPTVLAAKKEMLSWQTLMLEPSAMRAPASYRDPDRIDERGAFLPSTVFRLLREEGKEGQVCAELANRVSELVEDVRAVRVTDDPKSETLTLEVQDGSGIYHPARSLSDGTLRFLALATMAMDPQAKRVICLEEPENGIHPDRIEAMVRLLRDIAVDPKMPVSEDNPLRQIVINTHSGLVVTECSPDDVVYVQDTHIAKAGAAGTVTLTKGNAGTWRGNRPSQVDTAIGQLKPYLNAISSHEESADAQLWLRLTEIAS